MYKKSIYYSEQKKKDCFSVNAYLCNADIAFYALLIQEI